MKKNILLCVLILIEFFSSCKGYGKRKTDILWSSEVPYSINSEIKEAAITDINSDGVNEVIVVLSEPPSIYILDGRNGEILNKFDYTTQDHLTVGDINNDGYKEVVLMPLKVLSLSGKILWSKKEFQLDVTIEDNGILNNYTLSLIPKKSALIDLDNDGKLDIVVTVQSKWEEYSFVCGIRGFNGELLWCTPTEFGLEFVQHPIVGYRNNNPIVISTGCTVNWSKCPRSLDGGFECKIFAIDGRSGEILWRKAPTGCHTTIYGLVDVNKDGAPDIVSSHDEYNEVQCIDYYGAVSTKKTEYSILDVYTLDGDLIYSNTLPGGVIVFRSFLGSKNVDGAMAFGDIEGERGGIIGIGRDIQENGVIKCNSGYATLDTIRLKDGVVIASFPPQGEPVTGDLDGDGKIEAAMLTSKFIQTYNPEDGSALWWYDIGKIDNIFGWSSGGYFRSKPVIGDVNGDGFLEIVAIGDKDVDPDEKVYEYKRYVFALKTGAVVPSSPDLLPWPMSYHDISRTGNYHFVP